MAPTSAEVRLLMSVDVSLKAPENGNSHEDRKLKAERLSCGRRARNSRAGSELLRRHPLGNAATFSWAASGCSSQSQTDLEGQLPRVGICGSRDPPRLGSRSRIPRIVALVYIEVTAVTDTTTMALGDFVATGLLYRPACSGPLAQSRRTTLRMLPLPAYRSAPTAVKRAASTHPRLSPAGTSSASSVTRLDRPGSGIVRTTAMELGFWIAPVAAVVIVGLCAALAYFTRPKRRMVLRRQRTF